jgi:hypothetical protein
MLKFKPSLIKPIDYIIGTLKIKHLNPDYKAHKHKTYE